MLALSHPSRIKPGYRFDCLEVDIALCRVRSGSVSVPALLALGWRLEDLLASGDRETVSAARTYLHQTEIMETATLVAMVLTLIGASLILAYGFIGPALRGMQ